MSYTENLDDYMVSKETDSCYLDGRYFYKVFARYPGTISEPLVIKIKPPRNNRQRTKFFVNMKEARVDPRYPGLLRLVIHTPHSRHSNLLILDYEKEKVYRFEPLGKTAPYYDKINNIIEEYLDHFFDFDLEIVEIDLDMFLDEKNEKCLRKGKKTGFCTAYIILYAYCYLNNKEFDPTYIQRFAEKVQNTYGTLPRIGAEVDMGFLGNDNPNQLRNAGLGAIGGAAVGGLLLGSGAGVLGGAIGGGLIGSLL